jgi:N-hydroxyarylamine O-acetyltransferase
MIGSSPTCSASGRRDRHDVRTFGDLQRAHLTAVAFENLDVYSGRGVRTDTDWSVPKIVAERRGWWCFELNGAFGALPEALGFSVRYLAATVLLDDRIDPIPTHLALEVTLDRRYLVDVGFGDSFMRPLPIDDVGPHADGHTVYWFTEEQGVTTLSEGPDRERPQYRFGSDPVALADMDEANRFLQSNPELRWTTHRSATRLIDGGPDRMTLLSDRVKIRRDGAWTETAVTAAQWDDVLDKWFGMRL